MSVPFRRLGALALVVALSLGTAPIRRIQFSDTKLKNGLRVIVAEDHSSPVVAVAVTYNVGSRDERRGRTGFAHLFEHMMFKGSENVGALEHPYLVVTNGGSMNGTTSKERTLYFEIVPSNQLELALFLEADRMRSLDINRENFENQRQAVKEERRLGRDNQPYGRSAELLEDLAYENFAYEHSVIGSMEDLDAATLADVAAFFKTYYAPNNAVLGIAGAVDTNGALALARKYFEGLPPQPAAPAVDTAEPPQTSERRGTVDDPLARLPRLDMAFKIPPGSSPDTDAISVLATILSGGRSSRFYETVVRQKQLATSVFANASAARGTGLFTVVGNPLEGRDVAELEAAVAAEIERVKTEPIAEWEMQKARTTARSALVNSLGSALNRAVLLSEYALFYDDPDRINTQSDRIERVSAADVQRVARQYLVASNRTVVTTRPAKSSPGAPKGGK
jgi:predicted Zn-dependent peptidase